MIVILFTLTPNTNLGYICYLVIILITWLLDAEKHRCERSFSKDAPSHRTQACPIIRF